MRSPVTTARLVPLMISGALVLGSAAALWYVGLGRSPSGQDGGPAGAVSPEAIVAEGPGASPASSGASVGLPEVGTQAPDFTLTDLEGRPVRLSDLRGKAVLINFWATWCPPCREEMPQIEAFYTAHRDQVEVVGISVGESPEQVRAFLAEHPYSWRFLPDPTMSVTDRYRVFAIPTSYFIDAQGVVRGSFMGAMTADQIRAYARQAGVDVD
ncbi:MAG TPA: TlpA disulfide reductase family protein [Limnochordales bacterium]